MGWERRFEKDLGVFYDTLLSPCYVFSRQLVRHVQGAEKVGASAVSGKKSKLCIWWTDTWIIGLVDSFSHGKVVSHEKSSSFGWWRRSFSLPTLPTST